MADAMTATKWLQPQEVDDVTMAFPAQVVGTLLPEMDEIPEAFHHNTEESGPWYAFQVRWFYDGLGPSSGFKGVTLNEVLVDLALADAKTPEEARERGQALIDRAFRHLGAIQGSFQPKHGHKRAGVAWLASLWFGEVQWEDQ